MPSAEVIHQGLTTIANQWRWLAFGWHVSLATLAVCVFVGWRPSKRVVALLLVLPVMSVSALAWHVSNPFTGVVCALLAVTLVLLASRLADVPAALAPRTQVVSGAVLVAFAWVYPHFLHAGAWTAYLYEAPLGLVPCPTLSLVVGVSLILGGLGSRTWAATVASAGLLYGVIGVFVLGVTIDLVLVGGSLALGAIAQFGKRFRVYSIASLIILFAFGALTFGEAPRLPANLPTPWIGVWERIDIGVFLLWVVVLAAALLRVPDTGTGVVSHPSAFKSPKGKAAYLAAYNAAMKLWPVPYEEIDIPSRFGMTHVVVCGPKNAPPLVLLHGYWATLTMWALNVADLSRSYRVYAVDVMGQPSKSIPDEPIRSAEDYVTWLTATLNGLHLDRVSLVGMSYGGWLSLAYAVAAPERVHNLVLLSPAASFVPLVRQFSVRGMLMVFVPARFVVNSFMRWLGTKDNPVGPQTRRVGDNIVDLMHLGLKHFRMPAGVMPTVFSDSALRTLRVPTLLLLGDGEVIYDPSKALARAHRLVPDFQGDLLRGCSHDMCFIQHEAVDARILSFLSKRRT